MQKGDKIIEDHILHKYYDNGEDAHHVIFSVDLEILEESNWKYGFGDRLMRCLLEKALIYRQC